MEITTIELKKESLIEAKADLSLNQNALNDFTNEIDENESEMVKTNHQKALKNYKVVNILRVIAITITTLALFHFIFNNQPNVALLLLTSFAAGIFYNIQRP